MTNKRKIAVGLASLVFILSFIIPSTVKLLAPQDDSEETTSFFQKLMNEANQVAVIEDGDPNSRIALLEVEGMIENVEASPFASISYNHQKLLTDLEAMKTDETIDAILLRINSPGGYLYESAQLTDKIFEVKEALDIPVYTIMEKVAASGGYYVAMPSDKIYAHAETITGSIGVIQQRLNASELLDKLGIEDQTITSGDLKDMGSTTRESTEKEEAVLKELTDRSFERFIDVVEKGRPLSREEIYTLADGRIYDGEQAVENGLVDDLGYLSDALLDLRETYSLEDSQLVSFGASEFPWANNPLFNISIDGIFSKQDSNQTRLNEYEKISLLQDFYWGF